MLDINFIANDDQTFINGTRKSFYGWAVRAVSFTVSS
jgi:hypothetical protein